jgi:hypothetical protein
MLAQSLGNQGITTVKDGFATADFNRTTGKALAIAKVVAQGGAIVGMSAVPSLGVWGPVIGWVAGRQGSEELDEFANGAAKLAPQLQEIVEALGADNVAVGPYSTVGLMILTPDLGQLVAPIQSNLQVYVDAPTVTSVRPIFLELHEEDLDPPLRGSVAYNK